MKELTSWFIIALIITIGCIPHCFHETTQTIQPTKDVCGFVSQVEYENFKRLHRFHGTLSSWTEKDGSCVYMRNGQICSLWDPLTRTDR